MKFQMFRLKLEKTEEPEIKFPTSAGSSKKQENSRKNTYLCFIDYIKLLDCVDHSKLWKTLKEMGIPDHLTCLLRSLYAGQEATVRTGHGTTDWFQIGKRVCQGCILSPCLFNLYAEYIMWNAGLDETQARIKIAGRNINNLRYVDDTTEWQKVKRNKGVSWRGWKRKVKKLVWNSTFKKLRSWKLVPWFQWANRCGKCGNSDRFYFLGLQNPCRWWLQLLH